MIPTEEYEVFTAACHTNFFNWDAPGTTFADETASNDLTQNPLDGLGGLIRYRCLKHSEMLEDFAVKNAQPWPLEKRFEVANGYQLLGERRLTEPGRKGDVLSLSRVGFNSHGQFGLLYLAYYGGPLCGVGYFLLFERTASGWQLKDHCMPWVS